MTGAAAMRSRRWSATTAWSVAALALLVAAIGDGLWLPWHGDPVRGSVAQTYGAEYVRNHVTFGLARTLGLPMTCYGGEPPWLDPNLHHPPLYPLVLAAFAAVFGDAPWVLRAVHGGAMVVGFLAWRALVARHAGPAAAAWSAWLWVGCPFAVYFGGVVDPLALAGPSLCVAALAMQRHLDEPRRVRWWWPAVACLVACAIDWNGYFAAVALFGLAVAHGGWRCAWRALPWLAGAAAAAFAATAVHYGTVTGGPLGYLRHLLDIAAHERSQLVDGATGAAFGQQVAAVSATYQAWPCVMLALVGVGTAFPRGAATRPLVRLGALLALPGVLGYLAFPAHAVHHDGWSQPAFVGLAVLAAAVPMRLAGAARVPVLVVLAAVLAVGVAWSHALVGRGALAVGGRVAELAAAGAGTRGVAVVLTDLEVGVGRFGDGEALVVGGVRGVDGLERLLAMGRGLGEIAFVLSRAGRGTPLEARLGTLAAPVAAGSGLVFRFAVPR